MIVFGTLALIAVGLLAVVALVLLFGERVTRRAITWPTEDLTAQSLGGA